MRLDATKGGVTLDDAKDGQTAGTPRTASDPADFSLALGGPLYQLLLRFRLLCPPLRLLYRRIAAFALVTWLPLAVLAALGGRFLGGVSVPFLYDIDTHARFLVELPLLIASEVVVNHRLREIVDQFRHGELIHRNERTSFEAIVFDAMRVRNSTTIEIILLVCAFAGGYWIWRAHMGLHVATWYATIAGDSLPLTWAGYWYALVSLPVVRFILLRWYFRLLIWWVFLFRLARLKLDLNPLHPDHAGGLGFITLSADAFAPVLVAQTIFLAGVLANQIWYEGKALPDFKFVIAGFLIFEMLTVLLPLTFFLLAMARARRAALLDFGLLCGRYVDAFRYKWLRAPATSDQLLGSSDVQSLADLANSYAVVGQMRLVPFGRNLVIRLAILIVLPLLPLTLTMVPVDVILGQLVKLVL